MEPLVAGTRHLVDFSLSSPQPVPPRFIFVSTAGIFRSKRSSFARNVLPNCVPDVKGTNIALEEHISDPRTSIGLGYTESKWVAEAILETAAQMTTLAPLIVRPGQLSGAANGAWNSSDWFPVLVRSSQLLGHLPTITGVSFCKSLNALCSHDDAL